MTVPVSFKVSQEPRFSDVAVHCNHRGAFKKHRCLSPTPRDAGLIGLGHSLGSGMC